MKLILSDLHLGSPLFTKSKEVIDLLKFEQYDEIIINGDTIDTWENDWVTIVADNNQLIKLLNSLNTKVTIIHGNHDPKIAILQSVFSNCNVVNKYVLEIGDKLAIVVHGDEFDNIIRNYLWISRLTYYIHWLFERFGINIQSIVRNVYHSFSMMKKKKREYNSLVLQVEEMAVNMYHNEYYYIILGHTHLPKIVQKDNCVYINSGDMIHSFTYIKINDDKYELRVL